MNRLGLALLTALTGTLMARTELVHLRTESSRTFDNGDGTFTAQVHAGPIPAPGLDGRWDPLGDTNAYPAPPASTGFVLLDKRGGEYSRFPGDIAYGCINPRDENNHGYASFALEGFPDSAEVVSATLCYYQYYHYPGTEFPNPHTAVTLIPSTDLEAEQLYAAIQSGIEISEAAETPDGWSNRRVNSAGVQAIDSCQQRGERICLGLKAASCLLGVAYGAGPFDPERPYLEITYRTSQPYCDIVAVELKLKEPPCVVGKLCQLDVRLVNTGTSTAYDVPTYLLCNGSVVDTVSVDSLVPDDTTTVALEFIVWGEPKTADLKAMCCAPSDWCPYNDTVVMSTFAYPSGMRFAEGFELCSTPGFPPPGWAVHNGGDTNVTWNRNQLMDHYAHSGRHYGHCGDASSCDDWLITCGLRPDAATGDTIGFHYRSGTYRYHDFLQVWALGSQSPNDRLRCLLDTYVHPDTWAQARLSLDMYDGRTVYVGFRKYFKDRPGLCLDDIWFTSQRSGIGSDRTGHDRARLYLRLAPNVTSSRTALLCSLSSPGEAHLEIYDITGRTALSRELQLGVDTGTITLDLRGLSAGVYLVRLEAEGFAATQKLIIQR